MSLIVNLCEVLEIKVRIHLRRRDAGVAEHFLNGAQVAARLQHVGSERMSEHVRVDVAGEALLCAPGFQSQLHRTRADRFAALVQEQRAGVAFRQPCAHRQPGL